MQCNNMVSKDIIAGQILKLPIPQDLSSNKNHIDINHMTKDGFEVLGGSPDQKKTPSNQYKQKNTNPKGYTIDVQNDENPYRNPQLNSFLTGLASMDKEKPKKKKKDK